MRREEDSPLNVRYDMIIKACAVDRISSFEEK